MTSDKLVHKKSNIHEKSNENGVKSTNHNIPTATPANINDNKLHQSGSFQNGILKEKKKKKV